MDKKVQISLFSMEMRTLEPSPPGFSQPGTSKEYSCEVASSAGTMDLWTLGEKKGPDLRIYLELNTLDFKAQHPELKNQEKHQKNEKEERRLHLPWYFFVWLAQPPHPLAQDTISSKKKDTVQPKIFPSM